MAQVTLLGMVRAWLLVVGACAPVAHAELSVNGSLRGAYYSSSASFNGRNDVVAGALWLESSAPLSDGLDVRLDGWLRNDDVGGVADTHSRLREAYLTWRSSALDIRLGRQLIIWGRADRVNPTDNISPRDYTSLTPEDVDQRLGVLAASATYFWPGQKLSAHWLPGFRPNTLPIQPNDALSVREDLPHAGQGALKFDATGAQLDWSASYFNGLDLNPDMRVVATQTIPQLLLTHNRVHILGLDAATVVGRYGLRTEASYTWTSSSTDPLVKKPFLALVAGGDRSFDENLNLNIQYTLHLVSQYRDPGLLADPLLRTLATQAAISSNQRRRFEHGWTVRVADKWLHDTLEGELAGVVSMSTRAYALKPRLSYAIDDAWRATLGMNLYRGDQSTLFGQLRPTSAGFLEIKYSFMLR